ncbi:MAG: SLC13 family permease [Planctomycetota bacterium]|jgi:sodium-dependent dicarboxylate transporter 2/3/5
MTTTPNTVWRSRVQWLGLVAGPLLALSCYLLLPGSYLDAGGQSTALTPAGRATLALMAWMATWWLTEAIDISATALLQLALLPVVNYAEFPGASVGGQAKAAMRAAATPYASDVIYLFLGGFLLAGSMQRWGLDRRIALLTLRVVGTRPVNMIAGFMLATAVLSGFVSNTATAAMMLPIAMSVITLFRQREGDGPEATRTTEHLALSLMLGIAYAASIGGIATIVGTPPNGIFVDFVSSTLDEQYRRDISFARWLGVGVPLAAIMLPVTWLLLTRVLYRVPRTPLAGGRELIEGQYRALGPASAGEWATFIVFMLLAGAWIFRPLLVRVDLAAGAETLRPFGGLTDAGLAMIAGVTLFIIPVDRRARRFAMDWETARKVPWGILVLFGGGLSLAAAVQRHGVAEFIGSQVPGLEGLPVAPIVRAMLLVLIVTTILVFLTELTSNTATTATLLPVLAALAPGLGLHPLLLLIPAVIGASCAFMMPVATPPNALVFGFGYVTIPQMCRAGLWLNIIGILVITLLTFTVVAPLMGIDPAP